MAQRGVGSISIERALRWVQGFAEREWPLLLPVVLAFFGAPRLAVLLLSPRMDRLPQTMAQVQAFSAALPPWWTPLLMALLLAMAFGALVLMALALLPRVSVGEAIGIAARRFPVWLGLGCMAGAALFLLLLLVMTVAVRLGGGTAVSVLVSFLGILAILFLLLLLLPLLVVRRIGPVAALREGWHFYRGGLLRIVGGLVLFGLGAWIVTLALQVSLGSVFLLAARAAGQPRLGELLSALLMSFVAAIGWGGFYLLIAAFYRQRAGID